MAERSHNLHLVRDLPELVRLLMAQIAQVVLNVVAIILLFPQGAGLSVLFVVTAVGLPFLLQPLSVERNLTQRTHQAALARFYLDSLLGLIPLRAHHAETIMRREHESRLVEWARSSLGLIRIQIPAVAVQVFFTLVIHLLLMVAYIRSQLVSFVATTTSIGSVGPSSGGAGSSSGGGGSQLLILNGPAVTNILLMVYWTAAIYPLGRAIADNLQKYPTQRNVLLRLLEPLGAGVAPASAGTGEAGVAHFRSSPPTQTEESESPAVMGGAGYTEESAASPEHEHGRKREGARARERVQRCGPGGGGVAISIKDGGVRAAGHTLLEGIDLEIAPGEHVAIVGPSGAGKSSLVGLLLGWQRVATGQLLVDGQALTGAGSEADEAAALATLRQETAWVDPAIQLFNRSLLANLHYGSPPGGHGQYGEVGHILHEAELIQVVQNLPNGLQTPLGENGAMVSGGEGQRVRLGRAMARQKARLVILDEPFRGLGRDQRHHLLQLSRQLWQRATLLCITHDLSEAARFDRVIVMEHGTIVEDNHPTTLLQNPTSRFWEMLMAEASAGKDIWNGSGWRKFELSGGRLSERTGTGIEPGTGMPNLYIRSGI
jgi:ATP-binding cassette subfamily B protein